MGRAATERDDRVLAMTRVLAAVVIPFLVVAFALLYLAPNDTDAHFAWTIQPSMTPMVLGAVYLGGAWFFVGVFRASSWHTVRAGFPAVALLASLLGVATVLHWDRFNHDHVSFVAWAVLYFTTPALVIAAFVVNDRERAPAPPTDPRLPVVAARAIAVAGLVIAVTGVVMFLFPDPVIDAWPWALTPLTARVMGACFSLGLAGFVVAADPRVGAVRRVLEVAAIMLGLIAVAGLRARDDFDAGQPLGWVLLAGLAVLLAGGVTLWLRYVRPLSSELAPSTAVSH